MTSVFALLSLPKTSGGLTTLRPTALATSFAEEGSASPPRKVARLDTDSDSASASRSQQASAQSKKPADGPIQIRVVGEHKGQAPAGEKHLALLRRCIRFILTRNRPVHEVLPATYEGIYNACRSVVTISHLGYDLYNNLKIELEQSIGQMSRVMAVSTEEDLSWISSFNKAFEWFEKQIDLLRSLLTYLDQVYAVHEKDVLSVRDLAYRLVSERIFGSAQVVEKLRERVHEWLVYERTLSLKHDKQEAIPELIAHLVRHHQYSSFEDYYLEVTRKFYKEESANQAVVLKDNPKSFFNKAQGRIEAEVERAKVTLPISAWSLVREVTEKSLWEGRMQWLADSSIASFLNEKDFASLEKMYTLFTRVGGTDTINRAFRNHLRTTVENIVKDVDHDDEMVQRLLDFKALADKAISTSFLCEMPIVNVTNSTNTGPTAATASTSQIPSKQSDQGFVYALTDSFTTGFKARRSKPAEMIAKYLDKAMRKGQGKASDVEFGNLLDKVLALYRFTDDKDVFRTFYHRSLAKRLLLEKSASDDFEKGILKKLKENYDPEFGMGEDMFKDLALSRDFMRDYHSKLPEDSDGHNLNAIVLQRSAWPFTAQKHSIDIPTAMQTELMKYADFYKTKHPSHVLDWDHSLGTATLKARFNPGIKELSVSLYQAIILLLFNDAAGLSFKDIKAQTNMDDAELRRTLQSLACGKKKVLKKIPPGKEIDNSDVFRFNADFDDPHAKVHINSIQAKVSPEESKRTNASIEDDRRFSLDAAIVRIMKAKKEMTYEQLKTATIDAVKNHFAPQVETIKKRIESLVEQEYLERSEDKTKFLYVA